PVPPPPAPTPPVTASSGGDVERADGGEVDRVVPASGNLQVAGQQFWLGPHRAGQPVTLWIDTTTVHVALAGEHLKTVPSRLSTVDLARLRAHGARPAAPPPALPPPGAVRRRGHRRTGPAGARPGRGRAREPADPGRHAAGRPAG